MKWASVSKQGWGQENMNCISTLPLHSLISFLHEPAFGFAIPLTSLRFWWMAWCFGKAIHLPSNQISPGPLTLPSFILGDVSCSRFHSLKTKHENEGWGTMKEWEAHKQTDSWVWRCHSRLHSHTHCCSIRPLWRTCRTSVHTVVCGIEEERGAQNLRAD